MTDDKEDKPRRFTSIQGGKASSRTKSDKKKTSTDKEKPVKKKSSSKRSDARNQIYVTDDRFHRAMDLIRKDMNQALQIGNVANTQYYFLVKFLVKKGLIDEAEFTLFLEEELKKLDERKE